MARDPEAELSAVESMVADWEHRGTERLARVKEITDRVAGLRATETSPDGSVTVTVGSNGLPTDITVAEPARERPMSELSAAIMSTLRQAQARIPKMMAEEAAKAGLAGDGVVGHMLTRAGETFPSPEPAPGRAKSARASDDEYFGDMDVLRPDRETR